MSGGLDSSADGVHSAASRTGPPTPETLPLAATQSAVDLEGDDDRAAPGAARQVPMTRAAPVAGISSSMATEPGSRRPWPVIIGGVALVLATVGGVGAWRLLGRDATGVVRGERPATTHATSPVQAARPKPKPTVKPTVQPSVVHATPDAGGPAPFRSAATSRHQDAAVAVRGGKPHAARRSADGRKKAVRGPAKKPSEGGWGDVSGGL